MTTVDESVILERILVRAWEDSEFKEELLRNPSAVIEQETGYRTPEGVEIQIIEEQENIRYLTLPRKDASVSEGEETEQTDADDPLSRVIAKAVEDSSFREELINNPNAVVEEELGIKLPEGVEIRVLEHQEYIRYFVIPVSPEWEEEEEEGAPAEGWKIKVDKVIKNAKNVVKTLSITVCIGNKC